jgi:excisionase family DNA binding protein
MSISSNGASDEEKRIDRGPRRVAYSASELAQMFGVSEATIWRARKRGQLKAVKLGGRTLFIAESVEGLLKAA